MTKTVIWILAVTICLGGSVAVADTDKDSAAAPAPSAARVVEFEGEVLLHHEGQVHSPASWSGLADGDTVQIKSGARARIVFTSGEVVEKSGPAMVIIDLQRPGKECSLLGALSMVARALIFGTVGQKGERPMAVRGGDLAQLEPVAVPRLVRPYDGELLPEAVVSFAWQPIVGMDLYRLSLYDASGLIWQTTTTGNHLEYSVGAEKPLEAGPEYYWRVEALLGEAPLASWTSTFAVATPAYLDTVKLAVAELGDYVTDPVAARLLTAEVLFAARMYTPALETLVGEEDSGPNSSVIRKRADLLLRLEDYVALGALMPHLLEATVP